MKKNGTTIIESVVAIALLGLIFLLVAPLINSFGKVKNRVKTQKEIDAEFSVVNEFIQRKVKGAKSSDGSGDYAKVFDSLGNLTSKDGVELYLQIPVSGSSTPDGVSFTFNSGKLEYSSNGGTPETLMENVKTASFSSQEGIITYYIDLDIGIKNDGTENKEEIEEEMKFRSSFRGSASTRIDITD